MTEEQKRRKKSSDRTKENETNRPEGDRGEINEERQRDGGYNRGKTDTDINEVKYFYSPS